MADDTRPASLQVADALRTEIAAKALAPGDKLPSIRSIAERFGVAAMTAQSAIDVLRAEGLIYSSPGRGTFVRADAKSSDPNGPSSEFLAISEHLSALETQMQEIAGRVDKLEKLMRRERPAQR